MTIVMVIYCCGFHTPNNILITNAGFSLVAAGQLYLGTNRLLRPWGVVVLEGGSKIFKRGGYIFTHNTCGRGYIFLRLVFSKSGVTDVSICSTYYHAKNGLRMIFITCSM